MKGILMFLRGFEGFKVLYSAHTLVNASRLGVFVYAYLNIGIVNLIIWGIVCVFYIFQIIWKSGYYEFKELKKYYHLVEWIFHIVFHTFFIYTAKLYGHYEILFLEVVFYWLFDLMFKIYRAINKIKKRLAKMDAESIKDKVIKKEL